MEKRTKDLLDFWGSEDVNLWEIENQVENNENFHTLSTIFTPKQALILKAIINRVVSALEFHDTFEDSHIKINAELRKLRAQFRNHRHDSSRTLGGKAEY